ncbi:hypothetical protein NDU88_006496 [Pleurodeles waltl]|uniref:Uncharacterized protein n=1 Tax=Pleurodeles waltl TaxID=8319 RepID=A0AAV7QHV4_PLEWA|nr:hypothetical protein NDU88_006496 [Pleurodeles waltl]
MRRGAFQAARGSAGSNLPREPYGEPARVLGLTASPGHLFAQRLPPDTAEKGYKGAGGRGASGLHDLSAMLACPASCFSLFKDPGTLKIK